MNVIEQNPNDIISGIEIKSYKNVCKNTGALSPEMWENETKEWCRICPSCEGIVKHCRRGNCKQSVGKLCKNCFHNKQTKYLAELKIKNRIEKTCIMCKKTFWVSPSKRKIQCCSWACVKEARHVGIINAGLKGRGMPKECLELNTKYKKYKKDDERSNLIFDYTLEEFRNLLTHGECVYCHRKEWLGLDRIDNNLGHMKSNTIISCELCNMTRGRRFSVEEMKIIGKAIRSLNITNRRISIQKSDTNLWMKQNGKYE